LSLENIRNLFFDFDGTIGDSYAPVTESFNAAFRHFGKPEKTVDEIRPYVGIGLETTLSEHLGAENMDEGIRIFREQYAKVFKSGSKLIAGAREMLDAVEGRYRLALCSNKPGDTLRSLCEHLDIARYFEVMLGAYDVPHLKPHPAMLEAAMAELDATADDSLYVGDTTVDVEFAGACGVPYVLVLGGTGTREELEATKPVALLENIIDLVDLLRGPCGS
jgi:phosphoglycolate phosphatase